MSSLSPSTAAKPVHVLFVGAGAVGCFYASRLHHPAEGIHVSLVARSNYSAIKRSGVALRTHTFGDYTFHPHAVFSSPTEAAETARSQGHVWDFIVITTKALPDRLDDSATIEHLVTPASSCIVIIQNGVGVEEPFRKRFPSNPIVSAVTVISAEQTSPGVIVQNRWTRISIGPYTDGRGKHPNEKLVSSGAAAVDLLSRGWGPQLGGIRDVEPHDEVGLQLIRWHKLCINAAMNPSAVLSGGRGNADMVTDPELRHHLLGVMQEIWDATPRLLGRSFAEAGLAAPDRIVKSTERNTGARPSMLLDWEARRPLELEVILGNPVRVARAHGVELPRMQTLYALLRSAQQVREKKDAEGSAKGRGGKL